MAIDFSLLQPQPMPKSLGSVSQSSSPAPSGSDPFSQIAKGLAEGQNYRAKAQEMDQQAKLFPDVQKQKAADADLAQTNAQNARIKQQDAASQKAAFAISDEVGRAVLMKTDPEAAARLDYTRAVAKAQLAEAASKMATAKDTEAKALPEILINTGHLYSTAAATEAAVTKQAIKAGMNPAAAAAKGKAAAQQTLDAGLEQAPLIKAAIPPALQKYGSESTMTYLGLAHDQMVSKQAAYEAAHGTPLAKAQGDVTTKEMALKDANGSQDQARIQKATLELDQAKQRVAVAAQGPKYTKSPQDDINVATSIDAIKTAHAQSQKNIPIVANIEMLKEYATKYSTGRYAATLDLPLKQAIQGFQQLLGLPVNKTNAGVAEAIEAGSSQLKLQMASEMKNARMNTSMFNSLSQIPPNIENTPQGFALRADRLLYIKAVQNAFTDFQDKYIQRNGSISGVENQYNKFLESAPLFNKDGSTNIDHLKNDSMDNFLDPKYSAPKSSNTAPTPQGQGQPPPSTMQPQQAQNQPNGAPIQSQPTKNLTYNPSTRKLQ